MVNFSLTMFTNHRFYCTLFWIIFLFQPCNASGSPAAKQFIENGGYVVDDGSGLLRSREQDLFLPASTLKIFTSLVALEQLGDYRFETHFFIDEDHNLYIKGYGDPFLTSEVILEIGKNLAELGVRQVKSLFLDDSSFALNGETASDENSDNPYDAPNGALAVNFNALPVQVGGDTTISSGEPQTPLIDLMAEAGAKLSPGIHRINVDTLSSSGQLSPALRYTGDLFIVQFRQVGINVQKGYSKKLVPEGMKPIYIHKGSKPLEEIIRVCLKISNNYIANQLFLACGAKKYGLPATWDKSRKTFAEFAEKSLKLHSNQITVVEGSGLSRKNRMSPAALVAILRSFRPYSVLLNKKHDVLLKSGTMENVYCYAGYFPEKNTLIPFAILLNQAKNNRTKVLKVLHAEVRQGSAAQKNE
jgi:serine-type D-Ala-D-Ala carboxypeptidase/endopeptidase (penicillin-binding protein 4)